jgi:protein transport protein YIF1
LLSNTHKWLAPRHDVNAPDLYLPVMAFVTYVLLVGYVKGTNNNFTPEVLIQAVWSCLLIQMVEVGAIKVGLSMLQTTLPFLDLFSYTGYKYIGLCLATLSLLFGSTFYFVISLYTAITIAFFVLKTMAAAVPSANHLPPGGPPRHLVLLGFAGMQFLVHSLLCYF